jgi:hypothetical protein
MGSPGDPDAAFAGIAAPSEVSRRGPDARGCTGPTAVLFIGFAMTQEDAPSCAWLASGTQPRVLCAVVCLLRQLNSTCSGLDGGRAWSWSRRRRCTLNWELRLEALQWVTVRLLPRKNTESSFARSWGRRLPNRTLHAPVSLTAPSR